ncbi:acyl-CoA thioesterase [Flavobacterium sp. W21_SRS_FM6]|uniref:acyl-CoA thioesterase n=1 Tax=Flavobacterium sp. W21_SRS_FM6 TaxID=3240268 RepID=UPI003F917356
MSKTRDDFRHFERLSTRWGDNDMYGHVNNVVYYAYFDTVVNRLLIDRAWLDPLKDDVIAVVAETQCRFFSSVAFPQILDIGVAVERLGNRSVTYQLGVFVQGSHTLAALGKFVHVYVDNHTRLPVSIPTHVKQGLTELTVAP